jgi:hypothetical protein
VSTEPGAAHFFTTLTEVDRSHVLEIAARSEGELSMLRRKLKALTERTERAADDDRRTVDDDRAVPLGE